MKRIPSLFLLLFWLAFVPACTPFSKAAQPKMVDITKITAEEAAAQIVEPPIDTGAHDPVIIKDTQANRFYLFATGRGIPVQTSDDLKNWTYIDPALRKNPDWIRETVPEATDLWAPDVVFYNGQYFLLYSASSFGKNTSAIGLASNKTLDIKSADYEWVDEGAVLTSTAEDDFNAIDPNLALDDKGQPWLVYGSFWSGIKLRLLDPKTLKPTGGAETVLTIADRRRSPNSIEGAYLLRAGKYFYLFVSHDFCCRGVDSTYKIKVGRAETITGPYLDREGVDLADNGGTLVLKSSERWIGPGHNSILVDGNNYYLVYHVYDAKNGGVACLRIEELYWDLDGWPAAPSAILNEQK